MRCLMLSNTSGLILGLLPLTIASSHAHKPFAGRLQDTGVASAPLGAAEHEQRLPIRQLIGQYILTQHKSDPLPAPLHSDSTYTEILIGGTLDIQRNAQFRLRYTTRTTARSTGQAEDAPVELTGRVSPTPSGLRLTVTADNGEPSEEPWSVNATLTKRLQLVVTFDDGDLETLSFRKR